MGKRFLLAMLCLVSATAATSAHYLWILPQTNDKGERLANVYFEEGPHPGDGYYLDPFVKDCKVWLRTQDKDGVTTITMKEHFGKKKVRGKKTRWLISKEEIPSPCAIDSYGKFGVYRYPNKLDVLLHYNARHLDVKSGQQLQAWARAEHLDADIVPGMIKNGVELQVLWKGKPAGVRTLKVRGPIAKNVRTDKDGKVQVALSKPGLYRFQSYIELKEPGKENGKAYSVIRHHCTISMRWPLPKD